MGTVWTETPEQKRQRLADEVMGVRPAATSSTARSADEEKAERVRERERMEAERRIREYNERSGRGTGSLMERHAEQRSGRKGGVMSGPALGGSVVGTTEVSGLTARQEGKGGGEQEEEDDPSARAFDKEKDMKIGGGVGFVARREMVRQAKGMGGRFSGGSYL